MHNFSTYNLLTNKKCTWIRENPLTVIYALILFRKLKDMLLVVSQGASAQVSEVENSTVAIVQLAHKINDVSLQIAGVNSITGLTKKVCRSTDTVVHSLYLKTEDAVNMSNSIKAKIDDMNNKNNEIIQVIKKIKIINDQINILCSKVDEGQTALQLEGGVAHGTVGV